MSPRLRYSLTAWATGVGPKGLGTFPQHVWRVVVDCVVELPEGDFKLIEQAARARLSGPAHEEVELTTELIVAAKESPGRLDRKAIDAILGVVVPPAGAITRD